MPVITRFKPEFLRKREQARKLFGFHGEPRTEKIGEFKVKRPGGNERVIIERIHGVPEAETPLPVSPRAKFQLAQAALTPQERETYFKGYGGSIRQWMDYFPLEERYGTDEVRRLLKESTKPNPETKYQYLVMRKENGEVVGMSMTSVAPRSKVALFEYSFFKPELRGTGLAQAVAQHRETFAKKEGATHIFLETEPYGHAEAGEHKQLTTLPAEKLSQEQQTRLKQLIDMRRRLSFDHKLGFQVDPEWVHAHTLVKEGEAPTPLWLMVKTTTNKPTTPAELKLKQLGLYRDIYGTPSSGARVTQANIGKALNLMSPKLAMQLADKATEKKAIRSAA